MLVIPWYKDLRATLLIGNGYDLSVRLQWGNGNLDQDPLLDGAFIPQSGSPIINMGDPNLFFSDSDGTRNDIGNSGSNGIYVSSTSIDFGNVSTNGACCQNIFIYNLREEAINLQSVTSPDGIISITNESEIPIILQPYGKFEPWIHIPSPPLGAYSGELGFNFENLPNNSGTISVSAVGYNVPTGDIHVPSDLPDIPTAIKLVEPDQTIVVAPDEYHIGETLTIYKPNVTLRSEAGPEQTIINGSSNIVQMNLFDINDVNFTMDGFTIKDMDHGMAINAYDGRYSTFKNLILKNNVEYRFQKSTIENCVFTENRGNLRVQGSVQGDDPYLNVFKKCNHSRK